MGQQTHFTKNIKLLCKLLSITVTANGIYLRSTGCQSWLCSVLQLNRKTKVQSKSKRF